MIKDTIISLIPFSNLAVKLNKLKDCLFLHTGLESMIALPPFIPIYSLQEGFNRKSVVDSIKDVQNSFKHFKKMQITNPVTADRFLYIKVEMDELFIYLVKKFEPFKPSSSVIPPFKGFFLGYMEKPLTDISFGKYIEDLPGLFSKCTIGILSITYPLKNIWERVYWDLEPVKKINVGNVTTTG